MGATPFSQGCLSLGWWQCHNGILLRELISLSSLDAFSKSWHLPSPDRTMVWASVRDMKASWHCWGRR